MPSLKYRIFFLFLKNNFYIQFFLTAALGFHIYVCRAIWYYIIGIWGFVLLFYFVFILCVCIYSLSWNISYWQHQVYLIIFPSSPVKWKIHYINIVWILATVFSNSRISILSLFLFMCWYFLTFITLKTYFAFLF